MVKIVCKNCSKETFKEKSIYKFCSSACSGIFNGKKLKISRLSEGNPQWVGNQVGYTGIHTWVKRRLARPKKCSLCKKEKSVDLANISQEYKRDLNDWEWLCRKCHMTKDGRLEKLIERRRNRESRVFICTVCSAPYHPCRATQLFCSLVCFGKSRRK